VIGETVASRVTRLSLLTRYSIALATVGIAVASRIALDPLWGEKLRLLTFYPAIMVTAWLGGLGPGLTATLLAAAATVYLAFSWQPTDVGDIVALVLFVAIGVVISGLNEAWRRASSRLTEAAEELRITVASIGDAVMTTDEAGCITWLNPVAEALTGWSTAQAAGRPVTEVFVIINEESRRPAENPVGRVLREGVVAGLANHTVLVGKDGRETPIDDSAAPIRTADGRVTGVVLVFRDITERKEAERRRAVQHAATRLLADARSLEVAAPEILRLIGEGLGWDTAAYWSLDRDAGVLRCLEVWHRPTAKLETFKAVTLGRTFPKGVGLPGRVWATGEPVWLSDAAEDPEFLRASEAAKEGVHGAVFVPVYVGHVVAGVIEVLSQRVQAADPDVLVVLSSVASRVGHFVDRHWRDEEHARLLAREQEARRDAEAANSMKDEFLAMLSHELRTPLSTILGWARMLRTKQVGPDVGEQALATIERNAELQSRLIEDLLDVSRIVAGKLSVNTEPVDMARIVDAALEAVGTTADAKGINLTVNVDGPSTCVLGDPVRLQQIVVNLISNAIKFTDRGGIVDVSLRQMGATLELVVHDTGSGIRPEFLPYVFDRFRQDKSLSSGTPGGLGLGLTIVRHLVERHGGSVQAASPGQGRGATFTVRLPLQPPDTVTPKRKGGGATPGRDA
jgi:PAS domain S-box-containing protein